MMIFLLGFICGGLPWIGLIAAWYVRARRRVRSIQAAALLHRASAHEVGLALDKVFTKGRR